MSSSPPRLLRYARLTPQILASNPAHYFANQYALSIYRAGAVYSFIPKNACSTMRYTIGIENGAIAGPEDFNWIHSNNLTFRATLGELATAKYTFAILRDPYLRIGSCYLDKIVDQTTVAWHYHSLTNYKTPPEMVTFREFVNNLKSLLRSNEHWRPQLDFLVYEKYDDLFCLELFSDAIETLRQKIGIDIQDSRSLAKHGSDQFQFLDENEPFADKPAHEVAALKRSGRIPRITQLYDSSLIAQVGEMYSTDIAFYTSAIKRRCVFETPQLEGGAVPTQLVPKSYKEKLGRLYATFRLPILGYALQIEILSQPIWLDEWMPKSVRLKFRACRPLKQVVLHGVIPPTMPDIERRFTLTMPNRTAEFVITAKGTFELAAALSVDQGEDFVLGIDCNRDFVPAEQNLNSDRRHLAYRLETITFNGES